MTTCYSGDLGCQRGKESFTEEGILELRPEIRSWVHQVFTNLHNVIVPDFKTHQSFGKKSRGQVWNGRAKMVVVCYNAGTVDLVSQVNKQQIYRQISTYI